MNLFDFLFKETECFVVGGESLFRDLGFSVNPALEKGRELLNMVYDKFYPDYLKNDANYAELFLWTRADFPSKPTVFDVVVSLFDVSICCMIESKFIGFCDDVDRLEALKDEFLGMDIESRHEAFKEEDFVELRLAGEGSYGHVYCMYHKRYNELFAVKKRTSHAQKKDVKHEKELEIVGRINHPCIVFEYGLCNGSLVTEYCPYGTADKLTGEASERAICDAAFGLEYLHSLNLGHSNIKLDNIVIGYGHQGKLCDMVSCQEAGKDLDPDFVNRQTRAAGFDVDKKTDLNSDVREFCNMISSCPDNHLYLFPIDLKWPLWVQARNLINHILQEGNGDIERVARPLMGRFSDNILSKAFTLYRTNPDYLSILDRYMKFYLDNEGKRIERQDFETRMKHLKGEPDRFPASSQDVDIRKKPLVYLLDLLQEEPNSVYLRDYFVPGTCDRLGSAERCFLGWWYSISDPDIQAEMNAKCDSPVDDSSDEAYFFLKLRECIPLEWVRPIHKLLWIKENITACSDVIDWRFKIDQRDEQVLNVLEGRDKSTKPRLLSVFKEVIERVLWWHSMILWIKNPLVTDRDLVRFKFKYVIDSALGTEGSGFDAFVLPRNISLCLLCEVYLLLRGDACDDRFVECLRESGESYGKAWYVLGKYYSRQKRHYESVECFEKGIRVLRNDSCNRGSEIMKYEYFILRERSEEGRFSDSHKAEVERQLVSLYNGKDFPNFGFNRPVYLLLLLKLYLRFEKIDSSLVCDVLLNLLSLSSRGCFLSVYRLRDMFDLLDEVLNKRDVLSLSSEYVCEFEKFKESIDLEIEYWKSFGEKLDSLSKVWPRFRVQLVPGLERLRHESDEDHQIDARVCGFHLKYVIELLDESQRKEIGDMIEDFLKKYKRE